MYEYKGLGEEGDVTFMQTAQENADASGGNTGSGEGGNFFINLFSPAPATTGAGILTRPVDDSSIDNGAYAGPPAPSTISSNSFWDSLVNKSDNLTPTITTIRKGVQSVKKAGGVGAGSGAAAPKATSNAVMYAGIAAALALAVGGSYVLMKRKPKMRLA